MRVAVCHHHHHYYHHLTKHPCPPSSPLAISVQLCLFHGVLPPFPTSAPQALWPLPAGPQGGCWACPAPGAYALTLPAWPELGVSAAGVKGGGRGAGCWPAPGRRRCVLARQPPPGEGSGRAAPSLSCSQQWPWGQLCSLCLLPTWTQGSLTPSSWQPASCQPQLLPHHCPPPCPVSLDPPHPGAPLPER